MERNSKEAVIGVVLAGGLGFLTGATFGFGGSAESIEIVPGCNEVLDRGETLLPVQREQLTETIGRTAVCRMGEETFKIVLPRQ